VDIHCRFQKRHRHAADREDASRQASERRANTDTDRNAVSYGNRNAYSHANSNRDAEPNTNGHSKSNSDADGACAIWRQSVRASQKGQKIEKGFCKKIEKVKI
jgi:hypothetical protein